MYKIKRKLLITRKILCTIVINFLIIIHILIYCYILLLLLWNKLFLILRSFFLLIGKEILSSGSFSYSRTYWSIFVAIVIIVVIIVIIISLKIIESTSLLRLTRSILRVIPIIEQKINPTVNLISQVLSHIHLIVSLEIYLILFG